jgi:hypothetical protein
VTDDPSTVPEFKVHEQMTHPHDARLLHEARLALEEIIRQADAALGARAPHTQPRLDRIRSIAIAALHRTALRSPSNDPGGMSRGDE